MTKPWSAPQDTDDQILMKQLFFISQNLSMIYMGNFELLEKINQAKLVLSSGGISQGAEMLSVF